MQSAFTQKNSTVQCTAVVFKTVQELFVEGGHFALVSILTAIFILVLALRIELLVVVVVLKK